MAETIVIGAAVGAAFGGLLKAVLNKIKKARKFKKTLTYLQTILLKIAPLIREIEQQNQDLGRPKEELELLIREMEEGTELVNKCAKIHKLNYRARCRYQEKLLSLIVSLVMFFFFDMQAQTARDIKEILLEIRKINSGVNKFPLVNAENKTASYSESIPVQFESNMDDSRQPADEIEVETDYTEEAMENISLVTRKSSAIPVFHRGKSITKTENNQGMEHLMNEKSNEQSAKKKFLGMQEIRDIEQRYSPGNHPTPPASLVGGAAVEAAFGELLKAVLETGGKANKFKQTLAYLRSSLVAIAPIIQEIELFRNDLGGPTGELEWLIREMKRDTELVRKSSKIHRLNYVARVHHEEQLEVVRNRLERFLIIDMPAQIVRDQKEILLEVRKIISKNMYDSTTRQQADENAAEAVYTQETMENINQVTRNSSEDSDPVSFNVNEHESDIPHSNHGAFDQHRA